MRLEEINPSGQTKTIIGTFFVITSSGIGLTARHCVVWENCFRKQHIYERLLRVEGHKIKHIVSFPDLDISVFQLEGNDKAWPYISLRQMSNLSLGAIVHLLAYPDAMNQEGVETTSLIHGTVRASRTSCFLVDDYNGFIGCSGGAVVQDHMLIGFHVASLYSSELSQEDEDEVGDQAEKDEIISHDTNGLDLGDIEDVALSQGTVSRKVMRLENNQKHKNSLSEFCNGAIILQRLECEGVLRTPSKRSAVKKSRYNCLKAGHCHQ